MSRKIWSGFRHSVTPIAVIGMLAVSVSVMAGGVPEETGLNALIARIGAANVPTGAGVVVSQVEADDGFGNYAPNKLDAQFIGTNFTELSGPSRTSGHATTVGQFMYGLTSSISPEVNSVFLFDASDWVLAGFLRATQGLPPLPSPVGVRLYNHSWVGSFGDNVIDREILRRADFVSIRDNLLNITAVNNIGLPNVSLMAHMYNALCAGKQDGNHQTGNTPVGLDNPGRMKPEIMAPASFTSFAAPLISGAATMMFELAATDPNLASNTDANRAVVVKSVLLGGARHEPGWTNLPALSGPSRGVTSTPLDNTFGVGTVDVDRSHRLFTTSEQDGSSIIPGAINATNAGWDLVESFGSGQSRYWRFNVPVLANEVSIIATWFKFQTSVFTSTGLPGDMELTLWRVDGGGQLVDLTGDPGLPFFATGNVVSESAIDNIEHLYITDLAAGEYVLELTRIDSFLTFDVAVTWLFPEVVFLPGDINQDGTVNVLDLLTVLADWGPCPAKGVCPSDTDNNGSVDVLDLLAVLGDWGM